ncbi:MAG: biopolymer transporter ExbB [Gemmatimonadota bacterium]|nr:MAG: biopolymer transporter ExbB [Gemmatimonadota bacterium]
MRFAPILAALVAVVLQAGSVGAQTDGGASSLEELLQRVEQGRVREQQENRERETRFRQALDGQQELLNETKRALAAAERRSEQLEKTYDANELLIGDVSDQLDQRMGSLRELFGVLQQVTTDTQGALEASLVSAQLPGRGAFLGELNAKLGSTSTLPSIEEIERLWFLLQQEMTETGRVVRFPATIVTSDGREVETEVVRVGAFNLVTAGKYLQYTMETGSVSELGRQPQSRFSKTTQRLASASGGTVPFGIDPTRGQLLATLLERPSLRERVNQGGVIGYIILALGGVGLLIAAERLITLGRSSRNVARQMKSGQASPDNPLGRVLLAAEAHKDSEAEALELRLGEAIIRETPRLTRSLLFLRIITVVAPLLGLLGTVTGMIVTFQAITLFGTGDPRLMAGGISQALVTTVLGLAVAIPLVLLHTIVNGRSQHVLHVLEEQSAGIVADRAERPAS